MKLLCIVLASAFLAVSPMAQVFINIDDVVVSAPFINEPILGGAAQISGNFTQDSANQLAVMLSAGALPVPFEFVAVDTIE